MLLPRSENLFFGAITITSFHEEHAMPKKKTPVTTESVESAQRLLAASAKICEQTQVPEERVKLLMEWLDTNVSGHADASKSLAA